MMNVLLTGGSGSLGSAIARKLRETHPNLRIVVYSRDEGKQSQMKRELPEGGVTGLRYMLGDIRDSKRLRLAMKGCDTVIHAAAYKMIDVCEYDAWEAVSVNVLGTLTVARCCVDCGVRRAVFVSTDKAPDAVSVYGKTKAIGECIWLKGNIYGSTEFVGVRYGNVIGSAKSAFHTWKTQAEAGEPVTVTCAEATRFYWTVEEAAEFCIRTATEPVVRGCIYIPHMKSWSIGDIAKTYSSNTVVTGWRCPEKQHECLWTEWENDDVVDDGTRYVLYPYSHPWTSNLSVRGTPMVAPVTSKTVLTNEPWRTE